MLKRSTAPYLPRPTNQFDVAKDAIAMGHSPIKTVVLLIPWRAVIVGVVAITLKVIGG